MNLQWHTAESILQRRSNRKDVLFGGYHRMPVYITNGRLYIIGVIKHPS